MRRSQSKDNSIRVTRAGALVAAAASLAGFSSADAAVNTFTNAANAGSWADSRNWLGAAGNRIPTVGDTAVVPVIATAPQQVNFDYDYLGAGAVAPPDAVRIDGSAATSAILAQSTNNLVTTTGTIGDAGKGTLNQTGGTATFGTLTVGNQNGGAGTINNSGGGQLTVNGTGASALYLGFALGSTGTIAAGASLDASSVPFHVGYSGAGNLTVTSTTLAGTLSVGTNATGSGTVTLAAGGSLGVANTLTVGAAGTGVLIQTGGTLLINNQLALASAGGSGTYNFSGGILFSTGLANQGNFNQTGGTATVGAVTGAGKLTVGGGAGAAAANVSSFAQNSVTVGNNGSLVVSQNTTKATNTATTLSILGTGQLNLGNNDMLLDRTATPLTTVRQYIVNGYAGGTWKGTGGINSSTVANFNATGANPAALGYADGADGIATGLASDKVLVRYVYSGDANLDGRVNTLDLNAWKAGFGTTSGGTWTQGDFDYSGRVNTIDLNVWKNNFGQTTPGLPPATLVSAASTPAIKLAAPVTLTSGSTTGATPELAAVTPAVAGNGQFELDVDTKTGNVKIQVNNITLGSYEIASDGNHLLHGNFLHPLTNQFQGWTFIASKDNAITEFNSGSGTLITGTFDLGNIWQTGGAANQDLALIVSDGSGKQLSAANAFIVYQTPEPTVLGFLGLGVFALMKRRRKLPACS